jgi:hypothetical protein
MGPSGLMVRDNGSANGVFVNGRKVERSPLIPGDIIRIGETVMKVLAEGTGTVVMGPEESDQYQQTEDLTRPSDIPPLPDDSTSDLPAVQPRHPEPPPPPAAAHAPTPPPLRPPPVPGPKSVPPKARPAASHPPMPRGGLPRPLTVTVLAVLWLLAGAVYGALGLGYAIFGASGRSAIAAGVAGVAMAVLSGIVGFGLWARAPWARLLQFVLAGVGVFSCVFTLPSLAIIAYLLRPEVQLHFAGPRMLSAEESERAMAGTPETAFTAAIVGTLFIGLLIAAMAGYFLVNYLPASEVPEGKRERIEASPIPTPGASPN